MEKGSSGESTVYRVLFEKSPEGLAFCDPSKRIVMVNDEFCRLFGYEREEATGKLLDEVVVKDESILEEARKISDEFRRSGFLKTEAFRHKRDGSSFPVSIVATPVMVGDKIEGSLWIYRDITEPRIREEELKNREAKLSGILEAHPELILRFTPDLNVTYANNAYCAYHGITYDDAVGESFSEHVSPDHIPLVKKKLLSLTPENPVITGEEKVIMSSGELRWQEWTDQGIFDTGGDLIEIQSVGRDITERKKTEEALDLERDSLNALFENALEGMVLCRNDGTIIRVNPEFCRMFGYVKEELICKNIDEMVARDTGLLEEARAFTKTTAGGSHISSESTRLRKDGSPIEVSFLGVPIISEGGDGFSYGIYRDISDRKRAEEALKASEAKYRDLFEKMPNGFYTSTPGGYFVDANPAFVRMLGYEKIEELRSLHIPSDIYVTESERVKATPENPNLEFDRHIEVYRLKRKDGQIIWVEDNARYIRDDEGNVLFHQGICKEITDRKRAEEELIRLNRELMISATTDIVTGLYNRQYFDEILEREMAKSARYGTPLSLVMIDLDNFKLINDTRGHIAGDKALSDIAGTIKENIRSSDIAARWGGDEFIVASQADIEQALALAGKIRELIMGLDHAGYGPVTGSIGVSSFRHGDDINSLTRRADRAMYEVKNRGGNGVSADR